MRDWGHVLFSTMLAPPPHGFWIVLVSSGECFVVCVAQGARTVLPTMCLAGRVTRRAVEPFSFGCKMYKSRTRTRENIA